MNFDAPIDRRGTNSNKWDDMEAKYGVSPNDGLAMWVADTDFQAPDCIQAALGEWAKRGVYGYEGSDAAYRRAVVWWMQNRHGWSIQPDWIFSVHGLVNGTGMCIDTFTKPGDGVILFTPVYHAFARVIRASGRDLIECPLAQVDGQYRMDFEAYEGQLKGHERLIILCSPHNPGGRIWSRDELQELAAFARRHDMIIVSDEIHHDLTFSGTQHTVMADLDDISERLVTMTSATKTFNIAGAHTGQVIIGDPDLRARFATRYQALGISPNAPGILMTTAAFSAEGAAWVDELTRYIDGNRQVFEAGMAAIPGVRPMPLQGTYLAWIDFKDTGMEAPEILDRIEKRAKIAASHGASFGTGGDTFMRFNLGTQRSVVQEATRRLQKAFSDLQ